MGCTQPYSHSANSPSAGAAGASGASGAMRSPRSNTENNQLITMTNYGGGPAGRRSAGKKEEWFQVMTPDPDLGWRRMPDSIALPAIASSLSAAAAAVATTAAGSAAAAGGGAGGVGFISSAECGNWSSSTIPAASPKFATEVTEITATGSSSRHRQQFQTGPGDNGYGNVNSQLNAQINSNSRPAPSGPAVVNLYPTKHSWNVCFVNDRTGHYCHVSLITLAINIAIRAETLARAFGIVSDVATEPANAPGTASAPANVGTPSYSAGGIAAGGGGKNNRWGLNNNTSAAAAAAVVAGGGGGGGGGGCGESMHSHYKIYSALHVPDSGWRLIRRNANEPAASDSSSPPPSSPSEQNRSSSAAGTAAARAGTAGTGPGRKGWNRLKFVHDTKEGGKHHHDPRGKNGVSKQGLQEAAKSPILQIIKREPKGEPVLADVAEIGMNIAEQLYRLERKQLQQHYLPKDNFGWRFCEDAEMEFQLRVAVSSPAGESMWVIPEELIMNVTQWVQQTYLTSTTF